MHISEVEKHRMEKEHEMRNGYHVSTNSNQFPHRNEVSERQYLYKDMENKHAQEEIPQSHYGPGAP